MTEGGVGVWEKLTDDNDRGGGDSRKLYYIKNIEPDPNFLMFWVCGVEKNLQKLLNTQKGPRNNYKVHIQIFPTEAEEGKLVSISFMTILLILSDTMKLDFQHKGQLRGSV